MPKHNVSYEDDFRPSKADKKRDQQRRKDKRVKNALRNADIDTLMQQESD